MVVRFCGRVENVRELSSVAFLGKLVAVSDACVLLMSALRTTGMGDCIQGVSVDCLLMIEIGWCGRLTLMTAGRCQCPQDTAPGEGLVQACSMTDEVCTHGEWSHVCARTVAHHIW